MENTFTVNRLEACAISNDGKYLVLGCRDKLIFYDVESGTVLWNSTNLDGDVSDVAMSGDGKVVVAVTDVYAASPSALVIFKNANSKSGSNVEPDLMFIGAEDHTHYDYTDVSVDELGRIAVAGTGDYVFAVDTKTGELLWYYNGAWPAVSQYVEVSKDGCYVVQQVLSQRAYTTSAQD